MIIWVFDNEMKIKLSGHITTARLWLGCEVLHAEVEYIFYTLVDLQN